MDTEPLNQTTREKCSPRSFLYQISENTRQRSIALCQAAATALETEQEIRCMFEFVHDKNVNLIKSRGHCTVQLSTMRGY
jgi:hypothetical protein